MSYFHDVDAWLSELIGSDVSQEKLKDVAREIKNKLLESYHNGQKACPKCQGGSKARSSK